MAIKDKLERLFDLAAKNIKGSTIKSSLAQGKAFELYALLVVLRLMHKKGYTVQAMSPTGLPANQLRFAGGPANADKSQFTYFALSSIVPSHPEPSLEAWISVETKTLSTQLALKAGIPLGTSLAGHHEMDVAVFTPLANGPHQPDLSKLVFAASCKDMFISKAHVREALGLRRETGFFLQQAQASRAPWFIATVPANPATPLVLFARGSKCANYAVPVNLLGLYVRELSFP